jgi:hypothetical protein
MRTIPPPRLATWLLERFAFGEKRESLIGDLIEQHRNGRSASWYWRQAATAILAGAVTDLRAHKLLAIRAVMIGFACMWAFSALSRFALQMLWTLSSGGVYVGDHWIRLDYGWIRHARYFAALLTTMGSAASGWIVGRLHREHQAPVVFAFVTSVVVAAMVQLVLLVSIIGWAIRPITQYQHPVAILWFFVVVPASILLGGLWGAGPAAQTIPRSYPPTSRAS